MVSQVFWTALRRVRTDEGETYQELLIRKFAKEMCLGDFMATCEEVFDVGVTVNNKSTYCK